ncbi:MAG TPA: homoserine kinase [Opitutaceae bacterium]|nr:homoserine kinase [Opitutaceae bacterium]
MKAGAETVVVRVPASTSNCGAGFDTLGLALNLYNRVTLSLTGGSDPVPEGPAAARAQAMVAEAAAAFARATGRPRTGFRYRIEGSIPPARGLGSSVTVSAGVIAGLDALHRTSLERRRLVALVAAIEGHPDNAGAGILGGFCVSRSDPATGAYVDSLRFEVPRDIAFVVASPPVEFETKESRSALPPSLPYFDAVRSINSAAYLVAAFASHDFARLRHAGGDFVHEPYRLPQIPGGREAIAAGVAAGAWTGWLSGSGSSVLCVCERAKADGVFDAMARAFAGVSMPSEGRILEADNDGLKVEG